MKHHRKATLCSFDLFTQQKKIQINIAAAAIYSKYPDLKIYFSIKMVKRNVTVSVLTWSFCTVFVSAVTKRDKVCI